MRTERFFFFFFFFFFLSEAGYPRPLFFSIIFLCFVISLAVFWLVSSLGVFIRYCFCCFVRFFFVFRSAAVDCGIIE
jgi:hypothetical protein